MDVFEPLVDDGAPLVVQDFHVVPRAAHHVDEQVEMPGQHIGDEDGVRRLHLGREARIWLCEIGDGRLL